MKILDCVPNFSEGRDRNFLRATHGQVQERFVGLLARLLSGQGIGRIGRRAELGRCGGEAQVIENLPDLPAGRRPPAARSRR